MKYKKASEILPDELLREVQKYIDGEALYIPKGKARKKCVWITKTFAFATFKVAVDDNLARKKREKK